MPLKFERLLINDVALSFPHTLCFDSVHPEKYPANPCKDRRLRLITIPKGQRGLPNLPSDLFLAAD
jgi:hypothetical protein